MSSFCLMLRAKINQPLYHGAIQKMKVASFSGTCIYRCLSIFTHENPKSTFDTRRTRNDELRCTLYKRTYTVTNDFWRNAFL